MEMEDGAQGWERDRGGNGRYRRVRGAIGRNPGWERRWGRGWGAAKALQGSGDRAAVPAPFPPSRPPRVPSGRHRSSAPLQVLLFLNGWYCATYFLLEAFVFVYKGESFAPEPLPTPPGCGAEGGAVPAGLLLPYPVSNLVLDVVLLLLYLGIEATRIFFGESSGIPEAPQGAQGPGTPQKSIPGCSGWTGRGATWAEEKCPCPWETQSTP